MENGRALLLKSVLDRLGEKIPQEFEQRVRLQKLVYLAQRDQAVKLGYEFAWAERGPYSASLSEDIHTLAAWGDIEDAPKLKEQTSNSLENFSGKLKTLGTDVSDLEFAASVDFLQTCGLDPGQLTDVLKRYPTKTPHLDKLAEVQDKLSKTIGVTKP